MGAKKVCPLCGKNNNPSFSHCYSCKHELAIPVSEAERTKYLGKQGLPKGVIIFIIVSLFGLISGLPAITHLKDASWQEWFRIIVLNLCLIGVLIGLGQGKEWARKGVLAYLAISFIFGAFVMLNARFSKSASYELAFQKFQRTEQGKFSAGQRASFTDESLRREFNSVMSSNLPFLIGAAGIYNFIWIYYFAIPSKKNFKIRAIRDEKGHSVE